MTIPDDRGAAALTAGLGNGTSLPLGYRQRLATAALGERAVFLPDGLDELVALQDELAFALGALNDPEMLGEIAKQRIRALLRSTSPEPRP